MPARDPSASPHIPVSSGFSSIPAGSSSRRASVQHPPLGHTNSNGDRPPSNDPATRPLRPTSPGSSEVSTKGKRRWFPDHDHENQSLPNHHHSNSMSQRFDLAGETESGSSPSQSSLSAAAIRDHTLNLAASLASHSYNSGGSFDRNHHGRHGGRDEDEEEEREKGRPFGGTRLSRILDASGVDLVSRGSEGNALEVETSPGSSRQDISFSSSLSTPHTGPSALSVMMNRTSPAKSLAGENSRDVGTDTLAPGANGVAGFLPDPTKRNSRSDEEGSTDGGNVSPLSSSVGQDTPRPGTYKSLASLSSSSQTIRPGGKASGMEEDEQGSGKRRTTMVDVGKSAEESTPLLGTIRERSTSTSRSGDKASGRGQRSYETLNDQKRPETFSPDQESAGTNRSPLEDQKSGTGILHSVRSSTKEAIGAIRKSTWRDVGQAVVVDPLSNIPAVILGLMLNVLDGVSYGMITFPASPVFTDFGSIGVSMFFMSCIISQLSYTLGGSIFRGGNGSMMIEAVPFFHILTNIIADEIGDNDRAIISTTMVSFAFSAVLTGLVFFALGAFKLGALIGYFPRHILVGCIGGVGIFLIETGLEVSRGLKEEGFEYNLSTLKFFFESGHALALWGIPLALAILLRVITHRFHHQLIFPAYFFMIPIVFYIVVAIGRWDMATLRENNWVLDVGTKARPWYTFYTLFDFKQTNWKAFWACIPTQLALVFFGILHVPLNVPALGVSLQEDNVKLDRELLAHGFSNMAAGLLGTVPNYLCYVNTVLFYRVGGGSRLSGVMLAGATTIIMTVGPSVIGYLPVCVVGALIFVLGIDLVTEAIWDTRNRVNRMEYITIWAIAIGMTVFDFVGGLLLGIVLASLFFVIQNSRRRPIRAVFSGATAKSTVRRPHAQRQFIQEVGKQTYVMKLQGFLFFGTITRVEDEIRRLLDIAAWEHNPIRFLIVDFALVAGLDYSSAEAFVRVQRLLSQKDVLLILCGASPEGLVGQALQAVDLWADQEGTRIEVFDGLNSALEWCENAYLTAFYQSIPKQKGPSRQIDFPTVAKPPFALSESYSQSPRRTQLAEAGDSTLPTQSATPPPTEDKSAATNKINLKQPLPLLLQTFSGYHTRDNAHDFFFQVLPYFTPELVSSGETLWSQGEEAQGLYLIESGCLRATYQYEDHTELLQETMVAGTVAGELTALSGTRRNATVVVERDARLWKLSVESLERLQTEKPAVAREFVKLILKVAAEEGDVLSSHLIAVLS